MLADPTLLKSAAVMLAEPYRAAGITHVAGMESRGFILGPMIAAELGAGFVPVRKPGKLPFSTYREDYALEYGTDSLEMHTDAVGPGSKVLIHDDVIATGGTAAATCRLVERAGAELVGLCFIIELSFLAGKEKLPAALQGITSLISY